MRGTLQNCGAKRKSIDFEEEFNKISSMEDSTEPEFQISSQMCVKVERKETEETNVKKRQSMKL